MLKDSIWQIQHDKGHPNNLQGCCPICLFKKPLPPAHEVTNKVLGLIDDITDDYEKKHLKGVMTK